MVNKNESTVSGELSFGMLLRSFRLRSGLTQLMLAQRAEISVEAVGALERGNHRAPYLSTLDLLARALQLSPEERASLESAAVHGRARARVKQSGAPPSLPVPTTSFVGRESELDDLQRLYRRSRIVTIVGFGGIGKTRVAIEHAKRVYRDRRVDVRFVDLSIPMAGSVIAKIGSALSLGDFGNTPEGLASALTSRSLYLVLDNCEGDIEDVARAAAAIVRSSENVRLLATSREPLSVSGEVLYRLEPLTVPPVGGRSEEQTAGSPAVQLFRERAVDQLGENSDISIPPARVAEICRLLEGIPLAIELAAASMRSFGADELLERLDDEFIASAVARDVPERQRTMAMTMAWSHRLLAEDERILFRRVAIFEGGFILEAAEFVCADSALPASDIARLITALADKSLLQVSHKSTTTRYRMLDLVHRYARELLLRSKEYDALADARASWFSKSAEDFGITAFRMPPYALVARWHPEISNIRSTLEWIFSAESHGDATAGARIIGGFRSLWIASGQYVDLRHWLDVARSHISEQHSPFLASRLLWAYYWSVTGVRRIATAQRLLELLAMIGERQNSAIVRMHLAYSLYRSGDIAAAQQCAEDGYGIITDLGWYNSSAHAFYLTVTALLKAHDDRFESAISDLDMADHISRADSYDYFHMMWSPPIRVEVEFLSGNSEGALALVNSTLERALEDGTEATIPDALQSQAAIYLLRGEVVLGITAARALVLRTLGHNRERLTSAIALLASGLAQSGRFIRAARLLGLVDAVYQKQEYFRNAFDQSIFQQTHDAILDGIEATKMRNLLLEGSLMGLDTALSLALDGATARRLPLS